MIFFRPPEPHPRSGEIVILDTGEKAKIYWIFGQDKFYMVGIDDKNHDDGIRFQVVPANKLKLG